MTPIQVVIYVVVFLALLFLIFASITILTVYINTIASAIAKSNYSENIKTEMIVFTISLAIVLAYLLF